MSALRTMKVHVGGRRFAAAVFDVGYSDRGGRHQVEVFRANAPGWTVKAKAECEAFIVQERQRRPWA